MTILRSRAKGDRIVVDEPTDLPEGTEVTLALLDAQDDLSDAEQAELEAAIERGRADIAGGRGVSPEGLLSPAWEQEIARRLASMSDGRAELVAGEDVFEEIDAFLRSRRRK